MSIRYWWAVWLRSGAGCGEPLGIRVYRAVYRALKKRLSVRTALRTDSLRTSASTTLSVETPVETCRWKLRFYKVQKVRFRW